MAHVLGVGAPILDHIILIDEETLHQLPGTKEGMVQVEEQALKKLLKLVHEPIPTIAGGSASNTIKAMSMLGWEASLLGKIGKDSFAEEIRRSLSLHGVIQCFIESDLPTSQVACLIIPNGSRTFRSFFGAGQHLEPDEINENVFKNQNLVHLEGYFLGIEDLPEKIVRLAKKYGAKVSFDLGSFELVAKHRERIFNLIDQGIDFLFGNEKEMEELTQRLPEEACDLLRLGNKVVIITLGVKGSLIGDKENKVLAPAYPVKAVDTTGAGDFYSAGFLHGYFQGEPLATCGHFGSLLSAAVVQVYGTDLSGETWAALKAKIDEG